MLSVTRRAALAAAISAPALVSASQDTAARGDQPIRLGAPVFLKSDDPAVLAQEHRRLGYSAAYVPAAKAADRDRCKAIETAFKEADVVLAEVGAWKNMLAEDPAERKQNFEYIVERMALAETVGARCCVTIAGSYNPTVWYGPHPKNFSFQFFDETVENCRKIIDSVKPVRSKFTVEMMGWSIPSDPEDYLRLLQAVDRKAFGVHLDICNGINSPQRYYNNAAFTKSCFRLLGQWVVSCHAKDLTWLPEMNLHFVETVPGKGAMEYAPLLTGLAQLPQQPPMMLEHLKTPEEYQEGATYIREVADGLGLKFA